MPRCSSTKIDANECERCRQVVYYVIAIGKQHVVILDDLELQKCGVQLSVDETNVPATLAFSDCDRRLVSAAERTLMVGRADKRSRA